MEKWDDNNNTQQILLRRTVGQMTTDEFRQEKYIMMRHIYYIDNFEKKRQSELEQNKVPSRIFIWNQRIWRSHNWKIEVKTNLTGEKYYVCNKYDEVKNDTSTPGWRLLNLIQRIRVWCNNVAYHLTQHLFNGELGLKAFVTKEGFNPRDKLDEKTGKIVTDTSYTVGTFLSYLSAIWDDVFESRKIFEEREQGFIGKTFTRPFNIIWNYVIKGAIGTVLYCICYPILTIINIILTAGLLITTPVWVPIVAFITHLFNMLSYDFDTTENPDTTVWFPAIFQILKGLFAGIGRSLVSGVAIICEPIVAGVIALFGTIKNGLRTLWDKIMFHTVITHKGKIPDQDEFLVRRLSGPGLRDSYIYQMDPNLAILVLHRYLEERYIDEWELYTKKQINQPLENYKLTVNKFFGTFFRGTQYTELDSYKRLQEKTNCYLKELGEKTYIFKKQHIVQDQTMDNMRLSENDLKETLFKGAALCEEFYNDKIFPMIDSRQFWNKHSLVENDWTGLCRYNLTKLFGDGVLTPIGGSVDATEFCNLNEYGQSSEDYILSIKKKDLGPIVSRIINKEYIGDPLDNVKVNRVIGSTKAEGTEPKPVSPNCALSEDQKCINIVGIEKLKN